MKRSFRQEIDTRLSDLTFTRQAQVLAHVRPRRGMRSVPKRALVIALALMLMLCGTALALTLRFSARLDTVLLSRSVISAQYGLSDDMLDLFSERPETGGGSWIVRFVPINWKEQMGEYTVTGDWQGHAQASWTHDGAYTDSADSDGDLSSPVWGAKELQLLIDLRLGNQKAHASGDKLYEEMTLEELAAMDAPLMANPQASSIIHIAPEEGDILPDQAISLARQAVAGKYGASEETLDAYQPHVRFFLYTEDNSRVYRIELMSVRDNYWVQLTSPDGALLSCRRLVNPEDFTLPEGDLSLYPEAAAEYVGSGAFDLLSHEEKAQVSLRFAQAGMDELLPDREYLAPQTGDMSEEEAVALARQSVSQQFAVPQQAFVLFTTRTSLVRRDGSRTWKVEFTGAVPSNLHWGSLDDHSIRLGTYTAAIAADGSGAQCEWSLSGVDDAAYDASTFGAAQAYSGELLPYVMELLERLGEVFSRYDDYTDLDEMTLEDRAAYASLMRGAGYDAQRYSDMLPGEGDLTEEEAIALAYLVLQDEYAMTQEELLGPAEEPWTRFYMSYDLDDAPVAVWQIVLRGQWNDSPSAYFVTINAHSGVVEGILHDNYVLGNG